MSRAVAMSRKEEFAGAQKGAGSSLDFVMKLLFWALLQVTSIGKIMTDGVLAVLVRCGVAQPRQLESTSKKRANPPTSGSRKVRASPPVSGSRQKKPKAAEESESVPVYVEKERADTPTEKRIRALRKKLREIEVLEERAQSTGCALDAAAAEKVASRPALEEQIEALKQEAALEAHQEALDAKAAAEKVKAAKMEAARVAAEKAKAAAALAQARREALEVLANISPSSEAARNDPRLKSLLDQVAELSSQEFSENCLEHGVSKKKGWRLTLLARPVPEDPENQPPEAPDVLLGFVVFRFRPDMQCLSIAKIAVPEAHRGRGFGKHLMEWCTKYAQQQGNLQMLSLSSLPDAIKFYQKYGFRQVKIDKVPDDEHDYVEGQVYMEYRLKNVQRR
jgi:ribosomal protein S18 acetylase RimI-like enzyme